MHVPQFLDEQHAMAQLYSLGSCVSFLMRPQIFAHGHDVCDSIFRRLRTCMCGRAEYVLQQASLASGLGMVCGPGVRRTVRTLRCRSGVHGTTAAEIQSRRAVVPLTAANLVLVYISVGSGTYSCACQPVSNDVVCIAKFAAEKLMAQAQAQLCWQLTQDRE